MSVYSVQRYLSFLFTNCIRRGLNQRQQKVSIPKPTMANSRAMCRRATKNVKEHLPSGGCQHPAAPGIGIAASHQQAKGGSPTFTNESRSSFHNSGSGLALKLPGSRNFVISFFIHLHHQRDKTHNHFSMFEQNPLQLLRSGN